MVRLRCSFVKLWDVSGYSERASSKRPTCQKLAFVEGLNVINDPKCNKVLNVESIMLPTVASPV